MDAVIDRPAKRPRSRQRGSHVAPGRKRFGARRDLVPIDKTSGAGRFFTRMVREIETDLGPEIARIESELIQAFSGSATAVRYLTHQILLGEISELNLASYAQLGSTMLRIGSKLGLQRRAREVTAIPPTAEEYFEYKKKLKEAAAGNEQ